MHDSLSLTPGFSPVFADRKIKNRFNGFSDAGKPFQRLIPSISFSHPAEAGC
jgi:hypothetical protein